MESRQLDGKRVLLLLLEQSHPQTVHLVAGLARWNGRTLLVTPSSSGHDIIVGAAAVERDGFAPTMLRRLVADEKYLPMAEHYASEVAWCAPMLVDDVPEAAESAPGFLGGLATGAGGELYLMQVR